MFGTLLARHICLRKALVALPRNIVLFR